ncbi:MAG: hypothetical protein Q8P45_01600 [Candidatus Harrisonbacteria bacterium]|nr:hypothetical protein [Candidatus Harrisonbacteria bacterium]
MKQKILALTLASVLVFAGLGMVRPAQAESFVHLNQAFPTHSSVSLQFQLEALLQQLIALLQAQQFGTAPIFFQDPIIDFDDGFSVDQGSRNRAQDAIEDAEDLLEDLEDAIDDAEDDNVFRRVVNHSEDVADLIEDWINEAEDSFDEGQYRQVELIAHFAEERAELEIDYLDDAEHNNVMTRGDAQMAIDHGEDVISITEDLIDDARRAGFNVRRAEDLIEDAEDAIDDGEDEFDDNDWNGAFNDAEDGEELADEVLEEIFRF